MKTNQTLTRQMGNFSVYQRTSDGMFNSTELLTQWNKHSGQQKQMVHYTENASTKEFINALLTEENLKERNSVLIKTRGKMGGTWMHPLLFIDFAMWLNPTFKVKVLKFVYDQLIQYRIEAGDSYREMTAQIASISKKNEIPANITNAAKAINIIVYGSHERQMRNKHAEEQSMRELVKMQIKVTELIKEGFIKSYDSLLDYLRKTWTEKYQPKELS